MLRAIHCFSLSALLLSAATVAPGQDALAAAADRQAEEERMRTLAARVANLEESNQSLQRKVQDLAEQIHALREELARAANSKAMLAMQEDVRRLHAAIEELDKKRLADNSKTVEALEGLRRLIAERPLPRGGPPAGSPPPRTPPPGNVQEDGYNYTIKPGDTLSGIVAALRSQGWKITQKQITDANPNVNWNRLLPGKTTIFIPKPPQ